MQTVDSSTPAEWMKLTGQLVDTALVAADCNGFSTVALRWRHEPDAAVTVLIDVPVQNAATQLQAASTLWNGRRGSPAGI
jgi:hypothetical protein